MKTATKKATKKATVITEQSHNESQKNDALSNAKAAKKAAKNGEGRIALALTYSSLHSLLAKGENKVNVSGASIEFWKAQKTSKEFGGLTLRLKKSEKLNGFEKALIASLVEALTTLGFNEPTLVIRKSGSASIHV